MQGRVGNCPGEGGWPSLGWWVTILGFKVQTQAKQFLRSYYLCPFPPKKEIWHISLNSKIFSGSHGARLPWKISRYSHFIFYEFGRKCIPVKINQNKNAYSPKSAGHIIRAQLPIHDIYLDWVWSTRILLRISEKATTCVHCVFNIVP